MNHKRLLQSHQEVKTALKKADLCALDLLPMISLRNSWADQIRKRRRE
jgi:hypothetical protein